MPDAQFDDPRLAAVYDPLDPDRGDLDPYVAMTTEFGARQVVDLGCGTGSLAVRLAEGGLDVVGVDPALASLDVARGKPFADRVWWIHGTAADLPDWPADRGWERWTPDATRATAVVDGETVTSETALIDVDPPLVSFRTTFHLGADELTSDSTLRFRTREEIAEDLQEAGLPVDDVRDAPDRPGREFVVVARKPQDRPGTTTPDS